MTDSDSGRGKKAVSLDWLIGGVLTKVGDTFDRFTGRNWNPSSSLATSRLEERLRSILDAEAKEVEGRGRFVPHLFRLKIQWNKFSTDSDEELSKLEHELHAAAIDHINDRLYHTFGPISFTIAKDYFIEGVQLTASFGEFAEKEGEETAINVTLANIPAGPPASADNEEPRLPPAKSEDRVIRAEYVLDGKRSEARFDLASARRFTVGRGGTNDLVIGHETVSKTHAAVASNSSGEIVIADTGSTNGTFIQGVRIPYGKSLPIKNGTKVRFGDVDVFFGFDFPGSPGHPVSEGAAEGELFEGET